jgi:hypothetical protein
MHLVFIYGPPAAGKLTIARHLAARTGFSLFHNHLVVDAVHAVFPFGSADFIRLREMFWLETLQAACGDDRSLIFTFQPEDTVAPDFASRVEAMVSDSGGRTTFVRLTLSLDGQLARLNNEDRENFGKLRDPELLRQLHQGFLACEEAMPDPGITIDTGVVSAQDAADEIQRAL